MRKRQKFQISDGWITGGDQFEVEPTDLAQSASIAQHFRARRCAHNRARAQVAANLDARKADTGVPPPGWTLPSLRKAWNQAKDEVAPRGGGPVPRRPTPACKTRWGGGELADLTPGDRTWTCPVCAEQVDRNANAALNLRDRTCYRLTAGSWVVRRGRVAAPVPCVGDHGGQAHPTGWACEALSDHARVAGADDTSTKPTAGWGQNPNKGAS